MAEKLIHEGKKMGRVPTYIEGLDEQMQGGIPASHIILLTGTAGTMKSSIAFNIAYHEAERGQVALYLTLEQSSASLLNHMTNLGFDMSLIPLFAIEDLGDLDRQIKAMGDKANGGLVMADLGVIRKEIKGTKIGPSGDWLNVIKNFVRKLKENYGCDVFVLDSLASLYVLSKFENPRTELFYLFEFLRDLDITTILISEMPLDKSKYAEYGVEDFLADGVIKLELAERQRKVTREISIVKMRTTDCNNNIFTLEVDKGRFSALYGGQLPLI